MTTIGYATLQIIPSLVGVSEAIEKQLGSELPKVGQAAGKEYSEEFNKQVAKDAKPDEAITKGTKTAEAGKAAGKEYSEEFNKEVVKDVKVDEAITKSTKTAGGGVGKAAKEAAGEFGKGFREGVADALSQTTLDDTLVRWGGRVGEVLKPAVQSGLQQVSKGIAEWSMGIATDIRAGDIQGAADSITGAIQNTTNVISTIGDVFGIETGEIEGHSQTAVSAIGNIATKMQEVADGGGQVSSAMQTATGSIQGVSGLLGDLGGKDFASEDTKFGKSLARLPLLGEAYDMAKLLNDELTKVAGFDVTANVVGRNPIADIQDLIAGRPIDIKGTKPKTAPRPPNWPADVPWPPGSQHGGVITGPGGVDNVLALLTAGEGVIKKSAMANGGAEIMAALNAGWTPSADWLHAILPGFDSGGRVPYGLPAGTNTGGYGSSGPMFPDWVHEIEKRFGVKASTYPTHQEGSGLNKGIDWVGSVDAMQRFAEYLKSIRGDLEQVIWMNPKTGEKIGVADGQLVGPGTSQPGYYAKDWADHDNHVHTRQSYSFGSTTGGGQVADWDAIAMKESGGRWDLPYGDRDSTGGLQIRQGTWEDFGGLDFAAQPYLASKAQQIAVAEKILAAQGPQAWAGGANFAWKAGAKETAAPTPAPAPTRAPAPTSTTAPTPVPAPTSTGPAIPSSISGLSGWGLDQLGSGVGTTGSGSDLSLFGKAAGAAVSGQVASALGVFGVGDSPGWLQGLSKFVGGISVSRKSDTAAPLSAAPLSAAPLGASLSGPARAPDTGNMHGRTGGRPPGPVYNIRTATVEDAFIAAQRREAIRHAAKLSHL